MLHLAALLVHVLTLALQASALQVVHLRGELSAGSLATNFSHPAEALRAPVAESLRLITHGSVSRDVAPGMALALWRNASTATTEPADHDPDVDWQGVKFGNDKSLYPNIDGGFQKSKIWDKDDVGWGATVGAYVFMCLLALSPMVPHLYEWRAPPTKFDYLECALYLFWLLSGMYSFTHVFLFQSPHFAKPRTLNTAESMYLIVQVVTTVGYGDITPYERRGQLYMAFFVLCAVVFISKILGEMIAVFEGAMESVVEQLTPQGSKKAQEDSAKQYRWNAFKKVLQAFFAFVAFVVAGTLYFSTVPGEHKTPQEALYMSFMTLSTVGFGVYTPQTHSGMVFASWWMLFGVASLASFASAHAAFQTSLIRANKEAEETERLRSQTTA